MISLLKCAVSEEEEKMIERLLGEAVSLLFFYEDELETLAASAVVDDIGRYFGINPSDVN